MFDISVVICTYNRSDVLKDTIRSWRDVDKSGIKVELIIVDNNSTDDTHEIVKNSISETSETIIYTKELKAGLSFSRNRGIHEAGSRIIAFVDDDIYFDRNWVKEILNIFSRDRDIHCIGGNSIPVFEAGRPDWITDDLMKIYGATSSGDNEGLMHYPDHPFGLNMAFKKSVFDRIGLFNTKLGRIKKSLLSNEEKDIFYRIYRAGLKTYYCPKAIVYHRIPAERVDEHWILKRCYWQGISKVAFEQIINKKSRTQLMSDSLRNLKRALMGLKPYSFSKTIIFFKNQKLSDKVRTSMFLGVARQSFFELFRICR